MLCREGKISLYCFLGTLAIVFALTWSEYTLITVPNVWGAQFWGPIMYYIVINISIRFALRDQDYQVAVRATFLGFILAFNLILFQWGPVNLKPFGAYGSIMAIFHYSEFLVIAWTNPKSLTLDAFMLTHSWSYGIAAISSWLEFSIEVYQWPWLKESRILLIIGLILCVSGEFIRKFAIITANSNFNHVVQFTKAEDHKLVTHGVYNYMRHPSYVGWFWWSIGTQILLSNPICTILYTIVSWRFFRDRIFIEEISLLNFFGMDYINYQNRVPTGLPYITGYMINKHHHVD